MAPKLPQSIMMRNSNDDEDTPVPVSYSTAFQHSRMRSLYAPSYSMLSASEEKRLGVNVENNEELYQRISMEPRISVPDDSPVYSIGGDQPPITVRGPSNTTGFRAYSGVIEAPCHQLPHENTSMFSTLESRPIADLGDNLNIPDLAENLNALYADKRPEMVAEPNIEAG